MLLSLNLFDGFIMFHPSCPRNRVHGNPFQRRRRKHPAAGSSDGERSGQWIEGGYSADRRVHHFAALHHRRRHGLESKLGTTKLKLTTGCPCGSDTNSLKISWLSK